MPTDIANLRKHVLAFAGHSSSAKRSNISKRAKCSRPSGVKEQTALQIRYMLGKLKMRAGMHKSNQLFLSISLCSAMPALLFERRTEVKLQR